MRSATLLVIGGGCLLAACSGGESGGAPAPATPPAVTVSPTTEPPLPLGHPSLEGLRIASRGPRRLSVDELERSWEAIAGIPEGEVELPENLAQSLGEPDWRTVTTESLEPSPLFMKFMVDLGAFMCRTLIESDPLRPENERVLLRYPADVDRNLRQLILRFWAIDASAPNHPDVERLRAVFEAGRAGRAGDESGWMAVCLALATAPELLLH